MKNRIYLSITLAGLCILSACKKMDGTYKEYVVESGIIYPGKATAPSLKPGLNRVEISWMRGTDPKVVKAKIFWNNFTDSVEVPIPAEQDIITKTISNLPENYYSFTIKTYDKDGNVSVPVEISGNVYADRYRSTLLNRALVASTLNVANVLTIQFEPLIAGSKVFSSTIEYLNTANQVKMVTVQGTETSVQLTDYKPESSYKLRTTYVDPALVDAFVSNDLVVDNFSLLKSEWRIVAFSSQNPDANNVSIPANMIDGNPATRWLTHASTSDYPHSITIDLAKERTLKTVSLWRWVQTVADERGPNVVRFEGSLDNTSWTPLGNNYDFNRFTNNEQVFTLPGEPKVRYLKVVAVSGPMRYVIFGETNVKVK